MTDAIIFAKADEKQRARARERLLRIIDGFLPLTRAWAVDIKPYVKERSSKQNKWLHGVAYKLLSDATGYEREDIAEYLLGTHFGWKDRKLPGKRVVQVPIRTTTTDEDGRRKVLTVEQFAEYKDFIQRFGAEHGIIIPDPDPDYRMREAA